MNSEDQWKEIVSRLLSVAVKSGAAKRSGRGTIDDVVQSAIASGLAKDECPPPDDPEIYKFLLAALIRKLDTYRHNYRTGQGQTQLASQIGGDEIDIFNLYADLKNIAANDAIEPPLLDQFIIRPMVEHCMKWLEKQIKSLSDKTQQDVAELWVDGCSVEETARILSVSNYTVKTARRAIKAELRKRASE